MLKTILSWVSGGIIDQVSKPFLEAHRANLKAQNDTDRIVADLMMRKAEGDMVAAQNAKEVRMATAGFWEMRLITFLIAGSFTLHLVAVTLDTVFGLGWGIPAFPKPFDEWQGIVLLSFFGVYAVGSGIQAIAAGMMSRRRR